MRILAITRRNLLHIWRDKRTLFIMFFVPVFVMWLIQVVFNANTKTNVTLDSVNVNQTAVKVMRKNKHVTVHRVTAGTAKHNLRNYKTDAFVQKKANGNYTVTYANIDPTKTTIIKQTLKIALAQVQAQKEMNKIKQKMKTHATQQAAAMKKNLNQLPPLMRKRLATQQSVQIKKPKVRSIKLNSHYCYGNSNSTFFTKMVPIILAFMVFFLVFLISGLSLLQERTSGTLERVLVTPIRRSEIVTGYMLSYGLLSIIQTFVVVFVSIWFFKIEIVGNVWNVFLVNFLVALTALAFGIFLSTFARTEFEMVQFIPLVVVPQLLFSGIVSLNEMPVWAQWLSKILPITYAGHALSAIIMKGENLGQIAGDLIFLIAFTIIFFIINVVGLRRYRKV